MKRSPLRRKTPLKSGRPLRPGSGVARHTRMKRSGRLKVRKVSRRFAKRRNPEYRAFIRTFTCMLRWRQNLGQPCSGPVECAHTVSRGAGGFDVGDTVPLCRAHHRQGHDTGIKTFQARYGIDLQKQAALLASMWRLAKGYETPTEAGDP